MRTTSVVLQLGQLGLMLALPAAAQARNPDWTTYHNARFNFSVCYPPNLLTPKGESDNGDGQTFSIQHGKGRVLVYAGWADAVSGEPHKLSVSYAQALRDAKADGVQLSYTASQPAFFVLSGTDKGQIRYQKTMRAGDRDITLRFDYTEAMKQTMDDVVHRMSQCLSAGKQ